MLTFGIIPETPGWERSEKNSRERGIYWEEGWHHQVIIESGCM